MSAANELGQDYLKSEIIEVNSRLEIYRAHYDVGKIKCITLKRLINTKEEELRHLTFLFKELSESD